MPLSPKIKLKLPGSLKTRAQAQTFRFACSRFVANPELWMIQHELLPHRVTEDVAHKINENCATGNKIATRLYWRIGQEMAELDKPSQA